MFFEIMGNLNTLGDTDVCLSLCSLDCKVSCNCFDPEEPRIATRNIVLTENLQLVNIDE